jgi:hypothetical protein
MLNLFRKTFISCLVLSVSPLAQAQVVSVANISDPNFINMSMQSMQTNAQMLGQLATSVQNIQYNYQAATANNNLTNNFASFASIFSTISSFMNNYVCQDCTPGAWSKQQYEQFDKSLCENIAHILGTGSNVFSNIGQLAQDINQITNLKFSTMNPAQMAATQAQLLGSLGTGIQQTNTMLNANMQMQTAALAKSQLQEKDAHVRGVNAMGNFGQGIKP